jgi:hypothetical protein
VQDPPSTHPSITFATSAPNNLVILHTSGSGAAYHYLVVVVVVAVILVPSLTYWTSTWLLLLLSIVFAPLVASSLSTTARRLPMAPSAVTVVLAFKAYVSLRSQELSALDCSLVLSVLGCCDVQPLIGLLASLRFPTCAPSSTRASLSDKRLLPELMVVADALTAFANGMHFLQVYWLCRRRCCCCLLHHSFLFYTGTLHLHYDSIELPLCGTKSCSMHHSTCPVPLYIVIVLLHSLSLSLSPFS